MQTGRHCQACHVGGYGPQLTPFGREFKISGYTNRAVQFSLPVAVQVVASYVSIRANQAAPPTPDFHVNNNLALGSVEI